MCLAENHFRAVDWTIFRLSLASSVFWYLFARSVNRTVNYIGAHTPISQRTLRQNGNRGGWKEARVAPRIEHYLLAIGSPMRIFHLLPICEAFQTSYTNILTHRGQHHRQSCKSTQASLLSQFSYFFGDFDVTFPKIYDGGPILLLLLFRFGSTISNCEN